MTNSNDFYFWLGADGEPEAVTKEEFDAKIEEDRQRKDDWLNVTIDGNASNNGTEANCDDCTCGG